MVGPQQRAARPPLAAVVFTLALACVLGLAVVDAAPVPTLTDAVTPGDQLFNEDFSLSVTFSNSDPDPGFGPFVDILLPPGVTPPTDISMSIVPVDPETPFTFTVAEPCFDHPFVQPTENICGPTNWTMIPVRLPYASFFSSQPSEVITFAGMQLDSNVLTLDETVFPSFRQGFRFGGDMSGSSPSIVVEDTSTSVTPKIFFAECIVEGPLEVGPSYDHTFEINLNVANLIEVTDVQFSITWDENVAIDNTVNIGAGAFLAQTPYGVTFDAPNNVMTVEYSTMITGTLAESEAQTTGTYHYPCLDFSSNQNVPLTGETVTVPTGTCTASAVWTRDMVRYPGASEVLTEEKGSRSIGKSGPAVVIDNAHSGFGTFDVVAWTLSFAISDCHKIGDWVVTDTMSDGHEWDTSFTPTLTYGGTVDFNDGVDLVVDFSDIGNDADGSTLGTTVATYSVSDLLISELGSSNGVVGNADPSVSITYQTIVLNQYRDDPFNEPMEHGDGISNVAIWDHDVVDFDDEVTFLNTLSSSASAGAIIPFGELLLELYAINQVVCGTIPCPGEVIDSNSLLTYRLQYPLLATDYESLDLTAFLPVPLLDADDINTGSFDNMVETPPALGGSAYGPGDTYDDLTMISPTISVDSEINSVTFSFAPFEDPASGSTLIEILFTVSIQPTPYPDNAPLFFPAQSIENAGAVQASNSFSTLFVDQPELVVYKGVVGTDSVDPAATIDGATNFDTVTFPPSGTCTDNHDQTYADVSALASNPPAANIDGVDAGDLVAFALVVANVGHADAYNVAIEDVIPEGLAIPGGGLRLCVTNGDDSPVPYTGDLFSGGITMDNPVDFGLDPATEAPQGAGAIVVIHYYLEVAPTATEDGTPGTPATSNVVNFANQDGGPNFADEAFSYNVFTGPTVDYKIPAISVVQTDESLPLTGLGDLSIGETATFVATVVLPEGTTLLGTLDITLTNPDFVFDVAPVYLREGNNIGTEFLTESDALSVYGPTSAQFAFGTITNTADGAVTLNDEIDVQVVVRCIDVLAVEAADQYPFDFSFTSSGTLTADDTITQDIVEPAYSVALTASISTGDAGDIIDYTAVVTEEMSANPGPGYRIRLTSNNDVDVTYGSITSNNLGTVTFEDGAGFEITLTDDTVGGTTTWTVVWQVTVDQGVAATDVLTTAVDLEYLSAPFGTTGLRTYTDSDSVDFTVDDVVIVTYAFTVGGVSFGDLAETAILGGLAIGEEFRTELVIQFPEGTTDIDITEVVEGPDGNVVYEILSAEVVLVGGSLTSGVSLGAMGTLTNEVGSDGINDQSFYSLTGVVNTANGGSGADDRLTIHLTGQVREIGGGTVAGTSYDHDVTVNFGGVTPATAQVVSTLVEPSYSVALTASISTGDAGDVIDYTAVVTEGASANPGPGYRIRLASNNHADVTHVAIQSNELGTADFDTPGTGFQTTLAVDNVGGTTTWTVVWRVTVDQGVAATDVLTTAVDLEYLSAPDTATDYRTYTDSDSVDFTVDDVVLVTYDLTTGGAPFGDLSESVLPQVSIGEEIRTELVLRLPEGTTTIVVTEQFAFGDPNVVYQVLAAEVASRGANIAASVDGLAGVLSDSPVSDGFNDRSVLTLPAVVNTADGNPNDDDLITIHMTALVRDVTNVGDGDSFAHDVSVDFGAVAPLTDSVTSAVIEPILDIAVTPPLTTGLDAGNVVSYTVVVSQEDMAGSTAAAYNVAITSDLDPKVEVVGGTVFSSAGNVDVGTVPMIDTTFVVNVPVLDLLDADVVITFDAVVLDTVEPLDALTHQIDLDYASAPTNGRAYTDFDSVDMTMVDVRASTFVLFNTSVDGTLAAEHAPGNDDLAIGETARFRVTVPLFEGTSSLVTEVSLPRSPAGPWMQVVSANVVFVGANVVAQNLGSAGDPGTPLDVFVDTIDDGARFDFGTVVNSGDNVDDADDTIVIDVVAAFPDISPENVDGQTDAVLSDVSYGAYGDELTQSIAVDIVETNAFISSMTVNATFADAGDAVAINITVEHVGGDSNAPAFLTLSLGPLPYFRVIESSVEVTAGAVVVTGNNPGDIAMVVAADEFAVGSVLEVKLQGVVEAAVFGGEVIIPTVLDVASAPDPILARHIFDAANVSIAVDVPPFVLYVNQTEIPETVSEHGFVFADDVAIGENTQLVATFFLIEGTFYANASLSFPTAPHQVVIVSSAVLDLGSGLISNSSVPLGGAGDLLDTDGDMLADTVSFDFGDITVEGDNDPSNDEITVEVWVYADDVPINVDGTFFASVTFDAGVASNTSVLTIDVVEPRLVADLSLNASLGDADDVVEVTLQVSHEAGNSFAPAIDVLIDIPVPTGLPGAAVAFEAIPGSAVASSGTVVAEPTTGPSFIVPNLPVGEVVDLTFLARAVRVNATETYTAVANITWHTDPDRVRAVPADSNVVSWDVLAPIIAIDALSEAFTPIPGDVAIGELVVATATILLPEGDTRGLTATLTAPTGLAVVSADDVRGTLAMATSIPGGFAAVLASAVVGETGAAFDLGDVSNSPGLGQVGSPLEIDVTLVVVDETAVNYRGVVIAGIDLDVAWDPAGTDTTSSSALAVVEPEVLETADTNVTLVVDTNVVQVSLSFFHNETVSNETAFVLTVNVTLDSGLAYLGAASPNGTGLVTAAGAGFVTYMWPALMLGPGVVYLEVDVLVAGPQVPDMILGADANATYISLPAEVGPLSPFRADSDERAYAVSQAVAVTYNTPPVADTDDYVVGLDPEALTVLANDFDVNGNLDPTTVTVVSQPANGVVTVGAPACPTCLLLAPTPIYNGPDSFEYRVCDLLGECDTATVTLTYDYPINVGPTVVSPPLVEARHNVPTTIDNVTLADVDADVGNGTLTLTLGVSSGSLFLSGPGVTYVDGTLPGDSQIIVNGTLGGLNAALAAGNLTYQGDVDFFGVDALDLLVDDNGFTGCCRDVTGPLTDTSSTVIEVTYALATRLVFTRQPVDSVAGETMAVVRVAAVDEFGYVDLLWTGDVDLVMQTNPEDAELDGLVTAPLENGVGTYELLVAFTAGDDYVLNATTPGLDQATSLPFDVVANVPDHLSFVTQPNSVVAGETIVTSVEVVDAFDNRIADADEIVTVAILFNPPGDGQLHGSASGLPALGLVPYNDLTLLEAGDFYTLIASSPNLAPDVSEPFNVTAGPPDRLAFAVQPTDTILGDLMEPDVVVVVTDEYGNVVDSNDLVTLSLQDTPGNGGTLVGVASQVAVDGVSVFPSLSVDAVGEDYELVATAPLLNSDTSVTFDVTSLALRFTVQPTDTNAGDSITPAVEVSIMDNTMTVDTGRTDTITLVLGGGDPGATLGGTISVDAVDGVAVFNNLTVDLAEIEYLLSASVADPLIAGDTSDLFDVPAGAPAYLAFVDQPVDTVAGEVISNPVGGVTVGVFDAIGNLVEAFNDDIVLDLVHPISNAPLDGTLTVTATGGLATFPDLSIDQTEVDFALDATAPTVMLNATSDLFDIVAGPPVAMEWKTHPTTIVAGSIITPVMTVDVVDALGNAVVTDSGRDITIDIANNPGVTAVLVGDTVAATASGLSKYPGVTITVAADFYTLEASSPGLPTVESNAFNVTAGPAVGLAWVVHPADTTTDNPVPTYEVAVVDAFGNVVADYGPADITVAIDDDPTGGAAVLGGAPTTVAVADGTSVFPATTILVTGVDYTLEATSPGLAPATSDAFDVTAGAPAGVVFVTQPGNTLVNRTQALPVVVAVVDAAGNVVEGYTGDVTVAIGTDPSGGAAVLGTTLVVPAAGGLASFTDLELDVVGTGYTLEATAVGVGGPPAVSDPFDVTGLRLLFTVQPSDVVAGAVMAPSVEVSVVDDTDAVDTGYTGPISITLLTNAAANGDGVLGGSLDVANAVAGVAVFSDLTMDKTGDDYDLFAFTTTPGIGTDVSGPFDVAAGAPVGLIFVEDPTDIGAGDLFGPAPVTVALVDALGNVVTGFNGPVSVAVNNGPGTLVGPGPTTVTAVNGVAVFADLSVDVAADDYTLEATSPGSPGPTTSAPFDVTAGAPASLVWVVQPSDIEAGAAMSPSPTVRVEDAFGNPVTDFGGAVRVRLDPHPSGASLLGGIVVGGTVADLVAVDGVATLPVDLSADLVSVGHSLTAESAGLVPATSGPFDVTAGPAVGLNFVNQPDDIASMDPMDTTVEVVDAYGNRVTDFAGDVTVAIGVNAGGDGTLFGTATVAAVGGLATYTPLTVDVAGDGYTLTASSPNLAGDTSELFDVTVGPAADLVFVTHPGDVLVDETFDEDVVVAVVDAGGNVVTDYVGPVVVTLDDDGGFGGALGGTATIPVVDGLAVFGDLSVDTAGTAYSLTADASGGGGPGPVESNAFDVTGLRLQFSVQPSDKVAGDVMAPAVVVVIVDDMGTVQTGRTDDITLTLIEGNPGGVLGGTAVVAAVAGSSSYDDLVIEAAGEEYRLVASVADPAIGSATSQVHDVTAGPGVDLVFVVQPTDIVAGDDIEPGVSVAIVDAFGNVVTDSSDTVTLGFEVNAGPGASLLGTSSVAAVNGVATFPNLSVDKDGEDYVLNAVSPVGAPGATAVSGPFDVVVGPVDGLVFITQPSDTVMQIPFEDDVVVAVVDRFGNIIEDYDGELSIRINDNPGPGVLLGNAVDVTVVNGTATFPGLALSRDGQDYTLLAYGPGISGVVSDPFDVIEIPDALLGDEPLVAGDPQTLIITPLVDDVTTVVAVIVETGDVLVNVTLTGVGTWTGSVPSPLLVAGNYTLNVTMNGRDAISNPLPFRVIPNVPDHHSIDPPPPPGVAGDEVCIATWFYDVYDNVREATDVVRVASPDLGLNATVCDRSPDGSYACCLTPVVAGLFNFTFTEGLAPLGTRPVPVVPAEASCLSLQTRTQNDCTFIHETLTLVVEAVDQFGNRRSVGGDIIDATLGLSPADQSVNVTDNGDGTYLLSIDADLFGTFESALIINGVGCAGPTFVRRAPGASIVSVTVADPRDDDAVLDAGDTISIEFDRDMVPVPLATEADVDAAFAFNIDLGAGRTGTWALPNLAVVTVGDVNYDDTLEASSILVVPRALEVLYNISGNATGAMGMTSLRSAAFARAVTYEDVGCPLEECPYAEFMDANGVLANASAVPLVPVTPPGNCTNTYWDGNVHVTVASNCTSEMTACGTATGGDTGRPPIRLTTGSSDSGDGICYIGGVPCWIWPLLVLLPCLICCCAICIFLCCAKPKLRGKYHQVVKIGWMQDGAMAMLAPNAAALTSPMFLGPLRVRRRIKRVIEASSSSSSSSSSSAAAAAALARRRVKRKIVAGGGSTTSSSYSSSTAAAAAAAVRRKRIKKVELMAATSSSSDSSSSTAAAAAAAAVKRTRVKKVQLIEATTSSSSSSGGDAAAAAAALRRKRVKKVQLVSATSSASSTAEAAAAAGGVMRTKKRIKKVAEVTASSSTDLTSETSAAAGGAVTVARKRIRKVMEVTASSSADSSST